MGRIWILGADDPEIKEIENVLTQTGEHVLLATIGGKRCMPFQAYSDKIDTITVPDGDSVIAVECLHSTALAALGGQRIDHHNPGDPGYGLAPENYLQGSSLGQVLAILGQDPTDQQRLIAAADHCLQAAYQGKCPGVDPEDLRIFRIAVKAAFLKKSAVAISNEIAATIYDVLSARRICLAPGVEPLADMRVDAFNDCFPELPEAAAYCGTGYIAGPIKGRAGERDKFTCSGSPEQVNAFLAWAPTQGLQDPYGDPARGFAGAYIPA